MKGIKRLALTLALLVTVIALSWGIVGNIEAATTQDVTVNATPAYITISNAPSTYNFGVISEGATANTTNGYFTITNGSTVNIDISIQADNWTSSGSAWTYGNPGADTGNFDASSANGGVGGSSGAGAWDISVLAYSDTLICDNVTTVTNPTWELQLDAPSTFSHGDAQVNTVTVTGTAE